MSIPVLILAGKRIANVNTLISKVPPSCQLYVNTNTTTRVEQIVSPGSARFRITDKFEKPMTNYLKGVNWFFLNEPAGLILEDDMDISPAIFEFADIMLERFESHSRVFAVNCFNPFGHTPGIFFTSHFMTWGFATWRNKWDAINHNLDEFKIVPAHFTKKMKSFYLSEADKYQTNDYKFTLTIWAKHGYCVNSADNLVKHDGFDIHAERCHYDYFKSLKIYEDFIEYPCFPYDKKYFRVFKPNYFKKFIILLQNKALLNHVKKLFKRKAKDLSYLSLRRTKV